MKIKLYLREWFFNSGLIGFIRILQHNEDNFTQIKENYIEFDTESLRNFSKYYFKYFFDKYNVALRVIDRTEKSFEYIEDNIEAEIEDKAKNKEIQEKIKSNKKYIKETIKKQLDKIKKIDETIYNEMKQQYDKIDKEQTKEGIQNIKNIIYENIKKENINKKITLNLFKSILSSTYFGQPSFLNVVKSSLSYEEQQDVMYIDYISNIVEMGFIHDIIEGKYTIEQINTYIEDIRDNPKITKEMEKIYSKIKKDYIEKGKQLEDIQKYIKEKVINKCHMCENEYSLTTNYTEGNFVPLAVSSDNMRNFFWNQNAKLPICDICKLILFCIPAGITNITKTIKENGIYKEKQMLSFVNYDTSVNMLLKTNNSFSNNSKYDNKTNNPYSELILNIVEQDKQISNWQLQNIFVVEFEAEYLAFSRMEYFNIKRYVAEFFTEFSDKTLNKIADYRYKLEIVDYILKNKDIKYIINARLQDELNKENKYGYNTFLAVQTRLILNLLKKERIEVNEVNKNNEKLYVLYNLGIGIHEQLKSSGEENKLNGYTYKMLNSIKSGNKKEFMDIVIRIHMAMGKDISPIFLEIMQDTDLDFESIGDSFLSGLISNKYEKKEEEKVNE